jgi:hypothetical protein
MNILPFALGLFAASYIQNAKFKTQIDNSIKAVINKGLETLNNVGGTQNALPEPVERPSEE